jgi:hypothetical protein
MLVTKQADTIGEDVDRCPHDAFDHGRRAAAGAGFDIHAGIQGSKAVDGQIFFHGQIAGANRIFGVRRHRARYGGYAGAVGQHGGQGMRGAVVLDDSAVSVTRGVVSRIRGRRGKPVGIYRRQHHGIIKIAFGRQQDNLFALGRRPPRLRGAGAIDSPRRQAVIFFPT